jgi:hypothetical protein
MKKAEIEGSFFGTRVQIDATPILLVAHGARPSMRAARCQVSHIHSALPSVEDQVRR